jgi:sugar phosphate isomerase/epimerase
MHERLSVHSVSFFGASLAELNQQWSALGLKRLSLIDSQLFDPGLAPLIEVNGCTVEAVYHLFAAGRLATDPTAAREALLRVIDAAAVVGARTIYMLTGGRGSLAWEQAADRFCSMVGPCVAEAQRAGIALAIENASSLYVDMHIAHTLRDTVALAELAGLGVCIDVFHCWTEAGFDALVQRALPRTQLIQLSDYVLGDRSLPARAVPGDGAIPLEPFLARVLAGGYPHGFDLELIGPRIEQEGRARAVRRACETVSAVLQRLAD